MKFWALLLCSSAALFASEGVASYPVTYAGGSIHLNHHKVKASFDQGQIVFEQHGQRIAVPVGNITAISCGSDVHRRFGSAVLSVVPLVQLGKVEKDYIGITWTNSPESGWPSQAEALFQLNSREYREFLSALEKVTHRKAVDAHKTGTVVHYDL